MVVALLTERAQFFESWKPTGEVGPMDIASWVFLLLLHWLVLYGPGCSAWITGWRAGSELGRRRPAPRARPSAKAA
jgi:hypothetical protein